jgi:hypothetical protein
VEPRIRAAESTHWYTREGVPMYTVEAKNGNQRPTTLRDARALDLVPSVTTVLNVAAKPGLEAWKQRQLLLAALTLPRSEEEAEDVYLDRIIRDSREEGRAAADAGTEIHAAIQSFYEERPHDFHQHVYAFDTEITQNFGEQFWIAERSFSHELGYGGKVDLHTTKDKGIVLDIKTKDFFEKDKVEAYDEHLMQLAAYRVGLGLPAAQCANVFVSRRVAGLTKMIEWTERDLQRGFRMFTNLLQFWQERNQHK